MNIWILAAGIIGISTAFIHIVAGQVDPVRPFLKSNLPDVQKATLLACWHMVSVILILFGAVLFYAGWVNQRDLDLIVIGISLTYAAFSIVFVVVGWCFFGSRAFLKLPQWILLLPVGFLGLIGVP